MNSFFKNIKKHIIIYILLIGIGIASSIYFLDLSNMPRNEENIAVFVGSKGNKNDLKTLFENNTPNYVRRLQYRNFIVTDSTFDTSYKNYSYNISDLIIIPLSKIKDADIPIVYSKINEEVKNEFSSLTTFYSIDSISYGFKIHNKGTQDNTYLDYGSGSTDEDYYAFIKKGSIHGGSLSSSKYRTALDYIKVIHQ